MLKNISFSLLLLVLEILNSQAMQLQILCEYVSEN